MARPHVERTTDKRGGANEKAARRRQLLGDDLVAQARQLGREAPAPSPELLARIRAIRAKPRI